jgi:tetratricopeptide (TPR) repeat protein
LATENDELAWSLLQWGRMLPGGHPDKARRYKEALDMFGRLHGPRSRQVADAMHEYHVLGFSDADAGGIEAAFREALEIYREAGAEESITAIHAMHNLGLVLDRPGSEEEALALLGESVERGRRLLHPGAPGRLTMAINYGATLSEHGRLAEADEVLIDAVNEARFTLPDSSSGLAHGLYWYGLNRLAMNRPAEAERALRTASEIYRRLDAGSAAYHRVRAELAMAIAAGGRRDEAEAILLETLEGMRGTPQEATVRERLERVREEGR